VHGATGGACFGRIPSTTSVCSGTHDASFAFIPCTARHLTPPLLPLSFALQVAESKFLNNRLVGLVAFLENISVKDLFEKVGWGAARALWSERCLRPPLAATAAHSCLPVPRAAAQHIPKAWVMAEGLRADTADAARPWSPCSVCLPQAPPYVPPLSWSSIACGPEQDARDVTWPTQLALLPLLCLPAAGVVLQTPGRRTGGDPLSRSRPESAAAACARPGVWR